MQTTGGNGKYFFNHFDPPKVMNYYRLKMVDKDGKYTYSEIRKVDNIGAMDIVVYPNPAKDKLQIEINSKKNGRATVDILDISGRKILTQNIQLDAGHNLKSIDVSNLSEGNYLLKVYMAGKQFSIISFQKI